jgi:hypothetical protein
MEAAGLKVLRTADMVRTVVVRGEGVVAVGEGGAEERRRDRRADWCPSSALSFVLLSLSRQIVVSMFGRVLLLAPAIGPLLRPI